MSVCMYVCMYSLSILYKEILLAKTNLHAPEELSTLGKGIINTMVKINFGEI